MSGIVPQPKRAPATHSTLAGLGVLHAEREPVALDLLRRIVGWRDDVHAGRVVRGAELEALIEEARVLLADGVRVSGVADLTARWDRFIEFVRDKHDYSEVKNVIGGAAQLRRDFIAANAGAPGVPQQTNPQETP